MNWVDTPFLAYVSVRDHPARQAIEGVLRSGSWGSSVLVLPELYHVLTRDYDASGSDAFLSVELLSRSPIHWAPLEPDQIVPVTAAMRDHRIQAADASLLLLAQGERGVLYTPDGGLTRAAERLGVAVQNPVSAPLAGEIVRWEAEHLPPKGLGRILKSVERWLGREDVAMASRFVTATEGLTRLP